MEVSAPDARNSLEGDDVDDAISPSPSSRRVEGERTLCGMFLL